MCVKNNRTSRGRPVLLFIGGIVVLVNYTRMPEWVKIIIGTAIPRERDYQYNHYILGIQLVAGSYDQQTDSGWLLPQQHDGQLQSIVVPSDGLYVEITDEIMTLIFQHSRYMEHPEEVQYVPGMIDPRGQVVCAPILALPRSEKAEAFQSKIRQRLEKELRSLGLLRA